jgi:C4-dicarboxylate-specific signal transduction histidine kinase
MVSVTGVMIITFLFILLGVLFARANHALVVQQERNTAGAGLLEELCQKHEPGINSAGSSGQVRSVAETLAQSGFLRGEWAVKDADGNVIAGGLAENSYHTIGIGFTVNGSEEYILLTGMDRDMLFSDISEGLEAIVFGMVVGTLFLAGVVYLLTSRLILDPVLRLLAMTRVMKHGGNPGDSRLTQRKDEIGELVNSFSEMSREVTENRNNLQGRIDQAAEKIAKAQKELAFKDRLSATGKLASGVAHEINNPLAGVINAVKSMQKGNMPEDRQEEYFSLINEGLERIKNIVVRILTFARKEPAITDVDIFEPLQKALEFCNHRIEKASVVLDNACRPADFRIMADAGELQQVFLNLLVNALDAVAENKGTRNISIKFDSNESWRSVVIEDNGPGLNEDEIEKSFELFHTTKPAGEGTGLGLSISNDIVSRTGGTLKLESEKGKGTKAFVMFPVDSDGENV